MAADGRKPLFDEVTPASEIITLPAGGGWATLRAERIDVTLWGRDLATLLYSGPLAEGQRERNDGRYCLITVPRNPAAEILFLQREVWPALRTPFMSAGGYRGLEPAQVPPPDDARLERLEQNLLRAAWYGRAQEMGLVGSAVGNPDASAFRRFQEQVIAEEERNGFLHEAQHALDEAWKVYPERYRKVAVDAAGAELRAILAALAHSGTPHYVLYQAVRQYRQQLQPYGPAVSGLLALLAAEVAAAPDDFGRVRPDRSIPLQLPRLFPEHLREVAARAMAQRFAGLDQAAGHDLDYRPAVAAGDLRVGALRGRVLPRDLPPTGEEEGLLASWEASDGSVESLGLHIYLSGQGVRPAQGEGSYGLALGNGGYAALHAAPPPGPWIVELEGGVFRQGATRGPVLPLRVEAGDGLEVAMAAVAGQPGLFAGRVPAHAVRDGVLRLVLQATAGGEGPAFLTAVRLRTATP